MVGRFLRGNAVFLILSLINSLFFFCFSLPARLPLPPLPSLYVFK